MRIFLVTPYYPIVNRPDLFFDTKAIHYFTKQWVKDGHEVTVIHMYLHTFPIHRIKKYKLYFGRNIFENTLDGVKILMMENRFFFSLKKVSNLQQRIAARRLNCYLDGMMEPDILIVHYPCLYTEFIKNINVSCKRIGVLHQSDIKAMNENKVEAVSIYNYYDSIGYRSFTIKRTFEKQPTMAKNSFMVFSGTPIIQKQKVNKFKSKVKSYKILFVGKLIKLKNVSTIIHSLSLLNKEMKFSFTVVGGGPEEATLRKITEELGLSDHIKFLGELTREQVLEKMFESNVFVMVSSPETFGLVYIEAMSQGCITIGSRGEGIDGIIKDGQNGFLVEPGNVEELRECFEKINRMNVEEMKEISKKAIETAQEMTEKKMAKEYLENIKRIIEINEHEEIY